MAPDCGLRRRPTQTAGAAKMWPNDRPGLGVEVDVSKLTKIGEYATYRAGMLLNVRPDGSFTNW